MSQIYALFGVFFYNPDKCDGVPKWTNIKYGYIPSVVFSHIDCHTRILENIQISKTSKELLDRVGGFRCERRGIIDLPVSSFENVKNH